MSDLLIANTPLTVEVVAVNHAENVRNQMVLLKRNIDRGFLQMGHYMREVRDKKLYAYFKCVNLEEFCKQELDFSARHVRNLVDVYETFVEKHQVPEERLLDVGSTKLTWLARLDREMPTATQAGLEPLFTFAIQNTVENVANKVYSFLGHERSEHMEERSGEISSWGPFHFSPERKALSNLAVETAKRMTGSESTEFALEMIFAEFLATHGQGIKPTLTFTMEPEEQHSIATGLEHAQQLGYPTMGAFFAAVSAQWVY